MIFPYFSSYWISGDFFLDSHLKLLFKVFSDVLCFITIHVLELFFTFAPFFCILFFRSYLTEFRVIVVLFLQFPKLNQTCYFIFAHSTLDHCLFWFFVDFILKLFGDSDVWGDVFNYFWEIPIFFCNYVIGCWNNKFVNCVLYVSVLFVSNTLFTKFMYVWISEHRKLFDIICITVINYFKVFY